MLQEHLSQLLNGVHNSCLIEAAAANPPGHIATATKGTATIVVVSDVCKEAPRPRVQLPGHPVAPVGAPGTKAIAPRTNICTTDKLHFSIS